MDIEKTPIADTLGWSLWAGACYREVVARAGSTVFLKLYCAGVEG